MRENWRERLTAKLRSGRGASITFALLLFLVCAVIGSVVLAAGTAASGRVSQLAQADGRYYAVTSAAQLFREELNGQGFITVEQTRTGTTDSSHPFTRTTEKAEDGTVINVADTGPSRFNDSDYSFGNYSDPTLKKGDALLGDTLLGKIALALVCGKDATGYGSVHDFGVDFPVITATENTVWNDLNMTASVKNESNAVVTEDVDVSVEVFSNGTVKLTFSSDGLSVSFTMTPNLLPTDVSYSVPGETVKSEVTDTENRIDTVTYTLAVTETKTDKIEWTASPITINTVKVSE